MENREFEVTEDLLASHGQRILNYIIDIIIQYIIIFILASIIGIIASVLGATSILNWFQTVTDLEGTFIFIIIMLFYNVFFESLFSRTIAKYITQTKVVLEDGSKPGWQTILKRSLCRLIPFDVISFLGHGARGWHDSLSDTYVVKKKTFDQELKLFHSFKEIGKAEE